MCHLLSFITTPNWQAWDCKKMKRSEIECEQINTKLHVHVHPNSLDNKGSWRILKDFYCSVTMLRELGLNTCVYVYTMYCVCTCVHVYTCMYVLSSMASVCVHYQYTQEKIKWMKLWFSDDHWSKTAQDLTINQWEVPIQIVLLVSGS